MKDLTYMDLQHKPAAGRERERRTQELLTKAARRLLRAAELLASDEPNYREVLEESVGAIRQGYESMLEWHDLAFPRSVSLGELALPAENLASMLRTSRDRTLHLEALQNTLRDGAAVLLTAREQVTMSYYTARNTLLIILASLPARLTGEPAALIERAQAVRTGRAEAPSPSADHE